MKKIYTFGDGFASSHIWPEWPVILEALLPDCDFVHYGAVGAGNEYILNAIVHANQTDSEAYFLVQWAQASRFDKLLEDASWDSIIDSDPVYYFNRNSIADQTWWISSASTQPDIVTYHRHFVQPQQHKNRTRNSIYLAGHLLKDKSLFFSTDEIDCYFDNINWVNSNMSEFSQQERFKQVRQSHVQPSPVVHLAYVKEHLLPHIPFVVDACRLEKLAHRIHTHQWTAYDPDREEIWHNMCVL
jgi:hypothetical protein